MRLFASMLFAGVLVSCSSGGPAADENKSTAEIAEQAKAADTSALNSVIESYKKAIASHEGEIDDLEERIKELGGGALDAVLGQGKSDEVMADLEDLKADLEKLGDELTQLKDKLAIYAKELAGRPS